MMSKSKFVLIGVVVCVMGCATVFAAGMADFTKLKPLVRQAFDGDTDRAMAALVNTVKTFDFANIPGDTNVIRRGVFVDSLIANLGLDVIPPDDPRAKELEYLRRFMDKHLVNGAAVFEAFKSSANWKVIEEDMP